MASIIRNSNMAVGGSGYSTPFVHTMPLLSEVNNMAEMYPAFERAYENFKLAYNLCIDQYRVERINGI